jgi:hypothetical protein
MGESLFDLIHVGKTWKFSLTGPPEDNIWEIQQLPGNPEPGANPGRSRRCDRGRGGKGVIPATFRAHPEGKAGPNRLNREPEDLRGSKRG